MKKRIFIAPGHGGKDPGAVQGNIVEAECNLVVAQSMAQALRSYGFQVKLSRELNENDPLREQIQECNAYAPELAVAIHTNAGGGSGFELLCKNGTWANNTIVKRFAEYLVKRVQTYGRVESTRGVKFRQDLGWLNQVNAPAVLCENFFVDGPNAARYAGIEQLERLGKAYAMAVLDLYGIQPWQEDLSTYRISVIQEDDTRKIYNCQGYFANGHHYLQSRKLVKSLHWGVHYEPDTKGLVFFPNDRYAESDFGVGLLKISDFPTAEERALKGIQEIDEGYMFDEYD